MLTRRLRRYPHRRRIAAFVAAALPGSAFAADAAMSAWGAYLFFAIVATVVIVLLLHEALDDDPSEDQRREDSPVHTLGAARMTSPARYGDANAGQRDTRRTA